MLMGLGLFDVVLFLLFFAIVIGVSMYKSRHETSGEDFFLAGRSLLWPMIGISLIAANISTEQIVGQAGQGAGTVGLAVASYEWMAAVTLVIVAFTFLPRFLRSGIYTIPEFLEYRYNAGARLIMAVYMIIIYVGVTLAAVIYGGALTLNTLFGMDLTLAAWGIGIIAALYTAWGGLKAVAWADLFQGTAIIVGGIITMVIGFQAVGGWESFATYNADRLHMILPADDPVLPWTALVVGLWIPNLYYWGLNQYITQRTLAAKSLHQGQMGILFAAFMKLILPFVIIFPGIIAYQLYADQMENPDAAYPLLIKNLIPEGLRGFIFASLAGAVISTLASMLNSASTIFTMDLYKRFKPEASQKDLVKSGRWATIFFVVIGCIVAPLLGDPRFKGLFNFIQEFQGYISPGILAAFLFGIWVKRGPGEAGVAALVLSPILYGLMQYARPDIAFLNRMALTFIIILIAMRIITAMNPLKEPRELPRRGDMDMTQSVTAKWLGLAVVVITVILYRIFW